MARKDPSLAAYFKTRGDEICRVLTGCCGRNGTIEQPIWCPDHPDREVGHGVYKIAGHVLIGKGGVSRIPVTLETRTDLRERALAELDELAPRECARLQKLAEDPVFQ